MASPEADPGVGQRLGATALAAVVLAALFWYAHTSGGAADGPTGAAAAEVAPVAVSGEWPATGPIVPAHLVVPAIGVDAVAGHLLPGEGVLVAHRAAGQMAVVLGHEDAGNGAAVFDRLTDLEAGDEVRMRAGDGGTLRFSVLGDPVTGLDKATSALADTLNGHPADAAVALVTCGGEFDSGAGASEENTVVFAALVSG